MFLKCTSLVLRWYTSSIYFGRYENTRDIPEATETMAAIIAHTGPDLRIKSHGVFTGLSLDYRKQSQSFIMKSLRRDLNLWSQKGFTYHIADVVMSFTAYEISLFMTNKRMRLWWIRHKQEPSRNPYQRHATYTVDIYWLLSNLCLHQCYVIFIM